MKPLKPKLTNTFHHRNSLILIFHFIAQGGDNINELEMDIMYNISVIPADQREESVIKGVPNARGYVWIKVDPVYERFAHAKVKHKLEHSVKYIQVNENQIDELNCLN